MTGPPLTTVRQDVEKMGRPVARLLRRLATGPGAARDELAPVVTAARLVVRESG
ncbi:substrate-binding domain-containing protein [Streptomyces rimosus]|uniref:substrate-binding domain-containing protein n=1 Tax=Streptomyces rimosus TaxID=1927 RepID=UPI00099E85B3